MFPDHAEKPILTEGFNPSQPETAVSRSRLHLAAYADRGSFNRAAVRALAFRSHGGVLVMPNGCACLHVCFSWRADYFVDPKARGGLGRPSRPVKSMSSRLNWPARTSSPAGGRE